MTYLKDKVGSQAPRDRFDHLGVPYLMHPWVLTTVTVLIVNDHYWKRLYGNWLTGKLSDFSGVFFTPLVLCALVSVLINFIYMRDDQFYALTPSRLLAAILVTDVVVVALKVSPFFNGLYLGAMARMGIASHLVMDPGDLWALTMSVFTFLHGRRYFGRQSPDRGSSWQPLDRSLVP